MATFRKRGAKWQAQVRLQGHAPLSRSFTLKSDAELWARQTEAAIERGDIQGARTELRATTLLELLDRYKRTITPTKKGQTSETYRLVLRRHSMAGLSVDRLTASMVAAYRDDRLRLVSPSSVRRELAVLQHCLEIGRREWGVCLPKNPIAEIKKPAQGLARQRRITAVELERLRTALAKSRSHLLANAVHFAIHTGMRRSEILAIRWSDVSILAHTIHLLDTKNGQPRTVPLGPSAIAALPTKPADAAEPVFPMSANALRLAWERLKRRAGIEDLHFHDLRHEAVSRFFEMGLSVPEVSLIGGHKDTRMLFRYTHLKAEKVAEKIHTLAEDANEFVR